MSASLGEFPRHHLRLRPSPSSRATAFVLTALLFAGFAFLFSQRAFWSIPDPELLRVTVMRLMPDASDAVSVPPPQPVITHLIRPHAETIALPSYTVAAEVPAPLPPSAANLSPLSGGASAGAGKQLASVDGGAATTPSACLDPAWMRAVTAQVRRFFYQPRDADHSPVTGLVYVHFIVGRDGRLLESSISKSTGQRRLNDAALDILRLAAPLPQIPDRMHMSQIEAVLPMDFGGVGGTLKPSLGMASCR